MISIDMKKDNTLRFSLSKKQRALLIIGLMLIIAGMSVLLLYGLRKMKNEIEKNKMLQENPVIVIDELGIEAPILEGTDKDTLSIAVGHFDNTGKIGEGNYCIAGHSSTIYDEYFNDLKYIELGTPIYIYDNDENKTQYTYIVNKTFIIDPKKTWILKDFNDNRITIVTCTDDGTQRQIVVGILSE